MKRKFITTKLLSLLLISVGACYYYFLSSRYQLPRELSLSIPQNLPISIPYIGTTGTTPSSSNDFFEVSGDNREEIWAKAATQPRVGKVHALFGEGRTQANERSLEYHRRHSVAMEHPMFVLREEILKNVWSKHAYMQSLLTREMAKPAGQRLEWLMWVDADVIVMNPTIRLDIFIPPSPEFDHIDIVGNNDYGRLNDGVFMVRVCERTVRFFAMVIGFPSFKPEVKLKYSEQSSMEKVMKMPEWEKSVVLVPQYWFNAYRLHNGTAGHAEQLFAPGMLQIHFAGNRDGLRPDRMNAFMDIADQNLPEYNVPFEDGIYQRNIAEFWANYNKKKDTTKKKEKQKQKQLVKETATKTQSQITAPDSTTGVQNPTGVNAASASKNKPKAVSEKATKQKQRKR